MAVASNQDEGSRASGALVGGDGRGDVMGGGCGRAGRGDEDGQRAGGLARAAQWPTHGHEAITAAALELFWARDTADPGGLASARGLSRRLFPGGTVAQRTASAQETHGQRQREEEKESRAEATLARGAS